MKSKKWLISLGLAVVLVVAFAIPACTEAPTEWLHSPYTGEKIELTLTVPSIPTDYVSMASMIVEDLRDFGIDASYTTMDHSTYVDKMYDPWEGGLEMFIYGLDPAYDPWSDWIWSSLSDPYYMGNYWNGTYWYNATFDDLYWQNYHAADLEEKEAILYEMQAIINEELPKYMMVRPDFIAAWRTDRWTNWHNDIGGVNLWSNFWSIMDAESVEGATRMDIGFPSDMSNLFMDNDVLDQTTLGCTYKSMVYECLAICTKIEEGAVEDAYVFEPKLAVNYSVSTENRTHPVYNTTWEAQVWTIGLREGVKWHDGVNFTAYDVEYTAKNVWSPWDPDKPVTWEAYEDSWDEDDFVFWVEVVNDHTIEFIYENPINPDYAPGWWNWNVIAPKHIFEPDEREPYEWDGNSIGTGPFEFVERVPGEYQHWTRNDDWWGDLPEVQDLYCHIFPTTSATVLALQAGDIDTFTEFPLPPALIDDVDADPDITVDIVPGITVVYMGFNLYSDGYRDEEYGGPHLEPEVNPLQDVVLRQAIAYAIDVQAIIDLVYDGYGEMVDSFTYPESPNHNPDLEMYELDTTTARNMLLAANYTFELD
jgi:ABC-type transport system substrate-binding protein